MSKMFVAMIFLADGILMNFFGMSCTAILSAATSIQV